MRQVHRLDLLMTLHATTGLHFLSSIVGAFGEPETFASAQEFLSRLSSARVLYTRYLSDCSAPPKS